MCSDGYPGFEIYIDKLLACHTGVITMLGKIIGMTAESLSILIRTNQIMEQKRGPNSCDNGL
jgi:hypothetical protein